MLINKVGIEPVSITPVSIKKIETGGVSNNVTWGLNYNGVNTFGQFNPWSTSNRCEYSADVYVNTTHGYVLTSGDRRTRFYLRSTGFTFVGDGGSQVPLEAYIDGKAVDVNSSHPLSAGFHHLRAVYAKGLAQFIGSRHNGVEAWKGQITNLQLTEYDNKSNSRFYSGILQTYVDPDSSEVAVPTDFVLIDQLGTRQTLLNDNIALPEGSGYQTVALYDGLVVNKMYYIKANTNLPQYNLLGSDISGYIKRNLNQFFIATGTKLFIKTDGAGINPGYYYNIELTESTDGNLLNFGSSQPWSPLLGDREHYSRFGSSNNNFGAKRGVQVINGVVRILGPNYGDGIQIADAPVDSLLISGAVKAKVTTSNGTWIDSDIIQGSDQAVQYAFQYPHVFKVIKPTDHDYGDYQ